jgi:Fe-S-cluster containining protein
VRVTILDEIPLATLDTDGDRPDGGVPIPCHRCGVCCERWQPLLTAADAARLAEYLGLSAAAFRAAYTLPYPFDEERRLLRAVQGRCVFLTVAADGGDRRATCSVHAARPEACRAWTAGLDRKECVQGLARFADPDGALPLARLYPDAAARAAFAAALGR